jgi:hypothetical protein
MVVLTVPACGRAQTVYRTPTLSSAATLSQLIGVSEAELIRQLGPPTRTLDTAQGRTIVYERRDVWDMGRRLPATFNCRTSFLMDAGKVWTFERTGSDCR